MLDVVFGDIGCNTLLYFMNALDTGLAMGASEAERTGYILSRPEQAGRVISLIGDGTECHSGLDATRNAVYRNVPGVKVILDNSWTAMTGGQPSLTSPENLAGEEMRFSLPDALKGFEQSGGWFPDTAENHMAYAKMLFRVGRAPESVQPLVISSDRLHSCQATINNLKYATIGPILHEVRSLLYDDCRRTADRHSSRSSGRMFGYTP